MVDEKEDLESDRKSVESKMEEGNVSELSNPLPSSSKMKMADGSTILRRNRPGTKAKVSILSAKRTFWIHQSVNVWQNPGLPFVNKCLKVSVLRCRGILFSIAFVLFSCCYHSLLFFVLFDSLMLLNETDCLFICLGFLSVARWELRRNGNDVGGSTVHSTVD